MGFTPTEVQQETVLNLSAEEHDNLLEIIESAQGISTQEEFCDWMQSELQRVFPHGKFVCGIGISGKEGFQIHHAIGVNFPDDYVRSLQQADGQVTSPIIAEWFKEKQPVLFDPENVDAMQRMPHGWKENFHQFGLKNIAAHGVSYSADRTGSYFSFSDIPVPLNQRISRLLKLLIPHLHIALMRVVSNPSFINKQKTTTHTRLSVREVEILNWMSTGKSNWEIAQVLELSEATVRNHVHHILVKIKATSRAQAVAKAISLKLIRAKI